MLGGGGVWWCDVWLFVVCGDVLILVVLVCGNWCLCVWDSGGDV